MRHRDGLIELFLAVLLLAVPAAGVCLELDEMSSNCPMVEMGQSMDASLCHGSGQLTDDCCDEEAPPESTTALSSESTKLLTSLDIAHLPALVPPSPQLVRPGIAPPDDSRWQSLGRFTLFSSFLL